MQFTYDPKIKQDFPQLVTALLYATALPNPLDVTGHVAPLEQQAITLLAQTTEAELPAIRAWRAAFAQMGLKPTKYRSASEALLRRLRTAHALPRVNPLVDICNAVSAAHAVPVAAFDIAQIAGDLTVRPAQGTETYLTFGGDIEHPQPDEVIFADANHAAHARRWTNRQSAASAVSPATSSALFVIEALHPDATADVTSARDRLAQALSDAGGQVQTGLLIGGDGAFVADPQVSL